MSALRRHLDILAASEDRAAHRENDPVGFVHHTSDPLEQELVGLLASSLAFGQVKSIRRSIERALDAMHGDLRDAITRDPRTLRRRLDGFVHRVYRGPHIAHLLHRAGKMVEAKGSLGGWLRDAIDEGGDEQDPLREPLARFADALRGASKERGMRHLVPDPRAGSACKRLLLYLRWMVRPADGVDLGLWPISPSLLVVPVDTHILRIAHNLQLTDRTDASWRTALDITRSLKRFDAADPVRYDFTLCHLGISRACPSKRDDDKCASCALLSHCRQWS